MHATRTLVQGKAEGRAWVVARILPAMPTLFMWPVGNKRSYGAPASSMSTVSAPASNMTVVSNLLAVNLQAFQSLPIAHLLPCVCLQCGASAPAFDVTASLVSLLASLLLNASFVAPFLFPLLLEGSLIFQLVLTLLPLLLV